MDISAILRTYPGHLKVQLHLRSAILCHVIVHVDVALGIDGGELQALRAERVGHLGAIGHTRPDRSCGFARINHVCIRWLQVQ